MSIESDNRDIEVLFEEVMPGYRCVVTRQTEGAINLQFESLSSHKAITLPAIDHELWDSPDKLQAMCEQIAGEFLLLCEEQPTASSDQARAPIRMTGAIVERLNAIIHVLNGTKASH